MARAAQADSTTVSKRYVLKLYVAGATRRSQVAITNLTSFCEDNLKGRYELEVVDIYRSPFLAKKAKVIAAPTLVKQLPLPVRRLIGDLSQRDRVLVVLGLQHKAKS